MSIIGPAGMSPMPFGGAERVATNKANADDARAKSPMPFGGAERVANTYGASETDQR